MREELTKILCSYKFGSMTYYEAIDKICELKKEENIKKSSLKEAQEKLIEHYETLDKVPTLLDFYKGLVNGVKDRYEVGYTMAKYGNSDTIHTAMREDIRLLLQILQERL